MDVDLNAIYWRARTGISRPADVFELFDTLNALADSIKSLESQLKEANNKLSTKKPKIPKIKAKVVGCSFCGAETQTCCTECQRRIEAIVRLGGSSRRPLPDPCFRNAVHGDTDPGWDNAVKVIEQDR